MKTTYFAALTLLITSLTAEAQWRPRAPSKPNPAPTPSTSTPAVSKAEFDSLKSDVASQDQRVGKLESQVSGLLKAPAPSASNGGFRAEIEKTLPMPSSGYTYPKLVITSRSSQTFSTPPFTISGGVINVGQKGIYSFTACANFMNETNSDSMGSATVKIELGSSSGFSINVAQSSDKSFLVPYYSEATICTSGVAKLSAVNMKVRINVYMKGNAGVDLQTYGTFLAGHKIGDF